MQANSETNYLKPPLTESKKSLWKESCHPKGSKGNERSKVISKTSDKRSERVEGFEELGVGKEVLSPIKSFKGEGTSKNLIEKFEAIEDGGQ